MSKLKTAYKLPIEIANYQLYNLYDGDIDFDAEKLFSITDKDSDTIVPVKHQKVNIPVHVFLLVGNGKKILIDTGAGENFGAIYQSKFLEQLASVSITKEEITDIYLTHVHNDHTGGLIMNDELTFSNATIHLHENELDYWLNEHNLEQARTDVLSPNKKSFINAKKALTPYLERGQIKTFNAQSNFQHGFSLIEIFGHTPGHSLFKLSDSNNFLIFSADMVHSAELQFETPHLHDGFDIDKAKGIENRLKFYKKIADEKIIIAGTHLPYPGVGRLIEVENGYKFDIID